MSSKSKKIECLYVALDVLLDTRLGTLARMDEALVARVLQSGTYHTRDMDVFEGVDVAAFKKLYAERDIETLQHSVVTNGINLVKHLVGELAEQAIVRPYHDGVKIVVNTYPYQLTSEEQEEMVRAIAAWIQGLAPVELVFIPTKDLTPQHCKSSYAMMIVYEHEEWMNLHAQAFEHTRLPEVHMLAPAIYSKRPTAEELESLVREAAPPHRALEWLASPLIGLKLIEIKFFSILEK